MKFKTVILELLDTDAYRCSDERATYDCLDKSLIIVFGATCKDENIHKMLLDIVDYELDIREFKTLSIDYKVEDSEFVDYEELITWEDLYCYVGKDDKRKIAFLESFESYLD